MAENKFTATQAAEVAAALVQQDAYISALVSRNYTDEFYAPGRAGQPISVKIPTTLQAHRRALTNHTDALVMDTIEEKRATITLTPEMAYSAIPLSEHDTALALEDFSAQVLAPQCAAVADDLEQAVVSALAGVDASEIAFDPAKPVATFTALRKALRDNGVSPNGINCVVGTEVYAALLDADAISDASQSGSTDALREGTVGRVRGMTVVESNRVDDGEIFVFHRDAVTLCTRAPAVPQGAPFGARVAAKGFDLRYLRDYDARTAEDRSVVATFVAVAILPTFKADGTEVPDGGILHVVTGA